MLLILQGYFSTAMSPHLHSTLPALQRTEKKNSHVFLKLNTTKIKSEGKEKIIISRGRDLFISHEIVQLKKEGATTNYHSMKKNMKAANNSDLLIEFKVAFSLKSLS